MKKILIVNKTFPVAGLKLLKNKYETTIIPHADDSPQSLPEIKKNLTGIDALIWNTKHKLTKEILNLAGPQLSAITTMSSGTDHIDVSELRKRGLPLGNTPRVLDNAVADAAVGLLIAAARRFKEGVADVETGQWKYGVQWMVGQDITSSIVGVVGLGGVGQAIVRRLKGFDVARFLYCGRTEKAEAISLGVDYVQLTRLLKESDFIILACPLTAETRHLINAETLKIMKPNAVIINIARGEIIDQDALVDALRSKTIFSAGLDVVTPEPLAKDHPLVSLPNCYIIPHMGSATIRTRDEMAKISAQNIILALQSKPMLSSVF